MSSRPQEDEHESPTSYNEPGPSAAVAARGVSSPSPALSEGYPSWLPKRPAPPAPTSTLQSSQANVFTLAVAHDHDHEEFLPAAEQPEREPPEDTIPPLWGGRKPTPRSVRIVKTREVPDQTQQSRAFSRATGTGVSPALILGQGPRPRLRSPNLRLELLRDPSVRARIHFFLFPFFVLAHIPLQTFFDFNVVFVLIELAKHPNPAAPGVPGSGSAWALAAAAYIASWAVWLFGVFIGYELIYCFYRRWRYRRPLVMPIYLSSPAFNFASMTSFTNFCFFQHIRTSALPVSHARAVLPSAEGSWRDLVAETCNFYAQNLPTVALLLPRAGITLAVLLQFWSPVILADGRPLAAIAPALAARDDTFFDTASGALSGYARGVLAANAAWAAWRVLVLLISWIGLWALSGYGCAGLCGPATRWEEDERERVVSVYSEKDVEGAHGHGYGHGHGHEDDLLPWQWKECTALRVQEAFDFCLTVKRRPASIPPLSRGRKEAPGAEQVRDENVERVLAAVGLGGAAAAGPSRRGMLSQELFEGPGQDPRTSQQPYPFTGFGASKDGSKTSQEQVPFPPSPDHADGDLEGEDDGEGEGEGDEGEDEHQGSSSEPRTSMSASGRASNSLSSLGQPIPGRYPFTFRHPTRGGSLSSAGAFSSTPSHRHTPQSKSTSSNTGASRFSRSTGNGESSSDSPVSGSLIVPDSSPVGMSSRMPMPPRHPGAAAGHGRGRAGTVPLPSSPTPGHGHYVGSGTGSRVRVSTYASESGTDLEPSVLYESELENSVVGPLDLSGSGEGDLSMSIGHEHSANEGDTQHLHVPRAGSASPSPESVLALEREGEDSLGLLSSARTSSSNVRSRRSSGPSRSHSNSRSNSLHSHSRSPSSVSLALRARTQSLINSIGSASRSSIELVRSRTQSLVRIQDYEGEVEDGGFTSEDGSRHGGTASSAENYTFGQPVVGGAGVWRTGRRERDGAMSGSSSSGGEKSGSGSGSGSGNEKSGGERSSASHSGSSGLRHMSSYVSQAVTITTREEESESDSPEATQTVGAPTPSEPRTPTVASTPGAGTSTVPSTPGTSIMAGPSGGTPPVAIPGDAAAGARRLGVPQRPSEGMLSTAAPSLITNPGTVSDPTETSGRTPSSWGGDDYMHGRNMKPV